MTREEAEALKLEVRSKVSLRAQLSRQHHDALDKLNTAWRSKQVEAKASGTEAIKPYVVAKEKAHAASKLRLVNRLDELHKERKERMKAAEERFKMEQKAAVEACEDELRTLREAFYSQSKRLEVDYKLSLAQVEEDREKAHKELIEAQDREMRALGNEIAELQAKLAAAGGIA